MPRIPTDMDAHNLTLSEEQSMILDTVRKFARDQVEPVALENDEHDRFVRATFDGLAELGMLGIPIKEASGGAEMGWLSFAVAVEELGRACGSSGRLLVSQTALCALALEGHPEAEALAGGETLAAFVGPDAGILATPSAGGFMLSGSAGLVSAATEAARLVVCAKDPEGVPIVFCIDPALATIEPVPALGFRACAPGSVEFDPAIAIVPTDRIVARGEPARETLARVHVAGCIGAGALAVGLAEASRSIAVGHAKERVAFGKPLARQQAVGLKLADSMRAATAARHLVYHAARLVDAGQDGRAAANSARLSAVEAAVVSSDEAIQILGGYGFTVEYHVERHYRDAKTLEVMDADAESLREELATAALGGV